MKIYIASKSSNRSFALNPENVIAVCATGPDPLTDAMSYARDEVKASDSPAFIFEVDVQLKGSYRITKEVIYSSARTV